MAYFEAFEDENGKPMLRIIAKAADAETLAELAAMGKSPGPGEAAVIVDAAELMAWVVESINVEAELTIST
jgi:hypothetical protein